MLVIESLKSCEEFYEIPAEGQFGLERALRVAASNGQLDAIEALKSCKKFKEISAITRLGLTHVYKVLSPRTWGCYLVCSTRRASRGNNRADKLHKRTNIEY